MDKATKEAIIKEYAVTRATLAPLRCRSLC